MSAIDKETGCEISVGWEHHMVHAGGMYAVSAYAATIASAGTVNLLVNLTAASNEIHTVLGIGASGQTLISIYEGVTTSALGTTLTAYNMNRESAEVTTVQVYQGATWSTNTEKIIFRSVLPGGNSNNTRVGGSGRQDTEWIFAPNTKYLIVVENQAGATITASINMTYYEAL